MKNVTKSIFVGSFMLLSAFGFSQKSLNNSPNGARIQQHVSNAEFKLSQNDLKGLTVTDEYYSKGMDVTLVYVGQQHQGIPIFNGITTVAIKDGQIFNLASRFISNVSEKVNTLTPSITPQQAIEKVASHFKLGTPKGLRVLSRVKDNYEFSNGNISSRDMIPVKLTYVLEKDGSLRLYQDVEVDVIDGVDQWSVRVDAVTGEISERNIQNYTVSCSFEKMDHDKGHEDHDHSKHVEKNTKTFKAFKSTLNTSMMVDGSSYRVLPTLSDGRTPGVASPIHGDRELVRDPANKNASPFGWHDTNGRAGAEHTITKGNNVHAYLDTGDNQDGDSPDGGRDLKFDFPYDFNNRNPKEYRDAAVANLFYVSNMVHDIFYEYGFDEASGNFQENNYGNGGSDGDSVNTEAQDKSGTNNANFSTQPDGRNPRMQMFLWTNLRTPRDSDFDNEIIAHEYGHGISKRLAGGPGTTGCLSVQEQQGEGWSDWFGLMMTMNNGDKATDKRGIATFSKGQRADGNGLRARPYSTSFNLNNFTYDGIKNQRAPHGVGFVWATMLWDLTWAYIDAYGFSDDVYNGDAGNNKVMQLVLDGLKLQPCNSGFVDSRDALLAADRATTGGKNACIIWGVFAKRGLGLNARQGNPSSKTDGREGFDLPESDITITKTTDACGSEVPQFVVTNFNNRPLSSIDYTYSIDGGPTQNGTWTGDIGACESAPVEIEIGTLSRGAHVVEIETTDPDAKLTTTIAVNDIGTEDEVNTFERDSDELTAFNETGTNSLWERGRASGTLLSNANAGSRVYGTNLDGNTSAETKAYLMSQCYDLSDLDTPSVEFNLGFDIEDVFDLLTFQYSTDGGQEWKVLGTANDPNWFNNNLGSGGNSCPLCVGGQWVGEGEKQSTHSAGGTNAQMKLYKHSLAAFGKRGSAEKNMLFRFAFISDARVNEEGAIIDNFVIRSESTLSTNDVQFDGLTLWPNPTNSVVTIKSSTSLENARVSISDVMGRVLTQAVVDAVDNNEMTVDMSQFATGSYFLTIQNERNKSTRQIIKK